MNKESQKKKNTRHFARIYVLKTFQKDISYLPLKVQKIFMLEQEKLKVDIQYLEIMDRKGADPEYITSCPVQFIISY